MNIVTRTLTAAALGALAVGTLVACTTTPPAPPTVVAPVVQPLTAAEAAGFLPIVGDAVTRTDAPAPTTAPTTAAPAPTTAAAPTSKPPASKTDSPRTSVPRDNSERTWACDKMPDGDDWVTVCEGNPPASVGDYLSVREYKQRQAAEQAERDADNEREAEQESDAALDACVEQTGMTRAQCRADAAAGNAS